MKKITLVLMFVLLSAVSFFSQANKPIELLPEKAFNQEVFGIRSTVIKSDKVRRNLTGCQKPNQIPHQIPLHNIIRLETGDRLCIQVDREVNGIPMSGTGKKWFLAVVLFNPLRDITKGIVLVRDLRQFKNDYYFDVNMPGRVIPIIFLMTEDISSKKLVEEVGTIKGKEAVKDLSSGLNKYSTTLEKIQKFTEIAKKLLEAPPTDYKTKSPFNIRLEQISKIFNIELPTACSDEEISKKLGGNPPLTDWRLKRSECIAQNTDISKIKINWMAAAETAASEFKNRYKAIGKYSEEISLVVGLVAKFIEWRRSRQPQIIFAPARFKKDGKDKYRLFTQNSVVVKDAKVAIMIVPKPLENISLDTSSTTMRAELLEKEYFSVGINTFQLLDNELVSNDSVNFFLEIGDKRLPLQKSESGSSVFVDIKSKEELLAISANEKVKARIVGEYDGDKKIISNEMELTVSTKPIEE